MDANQDLAGLPTIGHGPCRVCGATGYPLSYGGPDICPSCDSGSQGLTIRSQRQRIADLERENAELRSRCNVFVQSTARFRGDKERAEADLDRVAGTAQELQSELAAMKRVVAESPTAIVQRVEGVGGLNPDLIVLSTSSIILGGDMIGHRVALLVLDGGDRER